MSTESEGKQAPSGDAAWKYLKRESLREGLLTSLWLIAGGVIMFLALQLFEGSDGITVAPWPVDFLYAIGGKWLVGGVCWALGGLAAVHSVCRYLFTDNI